MVKKMAIKEIEITAEMSIEDVENAQIAQTNKHIFGEMDRLLGHAKIYCEDHEIDPKRKLDVAKLLFKMGYK